MIRSRLLPLLPVGRLEQAQILRREQSGLSVLPARLGPREGQERRGGREGRESGQKGQEGRDGLDWRERPNRSCRRGNDAAIARTPTRGCTAADYTDRQCFLPFFDSVLQLIVRTSTDLPPDVRAAMKTSLDAEPAGTRASQALTIIAQNIDLAVEDEGAICQDTGMPTFEVKTPVGANQIWMRAADPRGGGRGDAARQAAAQLGRFDHRRELRRQPRARARRSSTSISGSATRSRSS